MYHIIIVDSASKKKNNNLNYYFIFFKVVAINRRAPEVNINKIIQIHSTFPLKLLIR